MNGKKVAIYFVGAIVLVCILIVISIQIFYATYEPKKIEKESTYSTPYYEFM